MSDLKINNITDSTGNRGPQICGVSTVSTTGAFVVPVGPTENRGCLLYTSDAADE